MSPSEAQQVWEEHYAERNRVWSGRANVRLVEVAASLPPGRALDLGCGEGGDAMWLAEHGWQVTAVDISQTALDRAAADARARDVADRIDFARHDLPDTFPEGVFDLVSAQFLHSMTELDRPRVLRLGAEAVAAGGLLLIVDHAGPPPWASKLAPSPRVPRNRGGHRVTEPRCGRNGNGFGSEAVGREATGPNGEAGTLVDNVIVLRRR